MMARATKSLLGPAMRPFTIMACAIVVLGIMDRGHGYFFSIGTVFSVMQLFATVGLVALGLGLSMLVREFDLSVAWHRRSRRLHRGDDRRGESVARRRVRCRRRRRERRAAGADHDAAGLKLGRRHAWRPSSRCKA
jgi:hypothetical protein